MKKFYRENSNILLSIVILKLFILIILWDIHELSIYWLQIAEKNTCSRNLFMRKRIGSPRTALEQQAVSSHFDSDDCKKMVRIKWAYYTTWNTNDQNDWYRIKMAVLSPFWVSNAAISPTGEYLIHIIIQNDCPFDAQEH